MEIRKLIYQIKNMPSRVRGLVNNLASQPLVDTYPGGVLTMSSCLSAKLIKQGNQIHDLGVLGSNMITQAGLTLLLTAWRDSTTALGDLHFHGVGTGTTAEHDDQTALVTEATDATGLLDATRENGTKVLTPAAITTQDAGAVFLSSVATIDFDGSVAVTEHGLFSSATYGAGTMWDRTLFSVINAVNTDQIQFTYQLRMNSAG